MKQNKIAIQLPLKYLLAAVMEIAMISVNVSAITIGQMWGISEQRKKMIAIYTRLPFESFTWSTLYSAGLR
jgi:hypothetical protein